MYRIFQAALLIAVAGALAMPASAGAQVRQYGADEHEARWHVQASRLACYLRQDVPLYGWAEFFQGIGEDLRFRLTAERDAVIRPAGLITVPPPWMHGAPVQDFGMVEPAAEGPTFKTGPATARALLAQLEAGRFPVLRYRAADAAATDVRVVVSAVRLRERLPEFHDCVANLLPFTYASIRESRLLFEFGESTLTDVARTRLDQVAEYMRADESVSSVTLEGHTDNIGFRRDNDALAEARAEAVRDYLVGQGVSAEKIEIAAYGERRPAYSNRTDQGRSLNRRVFVRLQR